MIKFIGRVTWEKIVPELLICTAPFLTFLSCRMQLTLCAIVHFKTSCDSYHMSWLFQHMELLRGHSGQPTGKSSSGRMQRHHHSGHGPHSSSISSHAIRHSSASAILSSDPPGSGSMSRGPSEVNSDSDDACSTPGVGVNAGSSMFMGSSADLVNTTSTRSASSPSGGNQRGSFVMESVSKPSKSPLSLFFLPVIQVLDCIAVHRNRTFTDHG